MNKEYTKNDTVFAIISFVIGYLFVKLVFRPYLGVSVTAFTLVFICFALAYLMISKIRLEIKDWFLLGIIFLFGLNFTFSANIFIKFLDLLFIMFAVVYFALTASKNREAEKLNDMFVFDMIKSTFVIPFGGFGAVFGALKRLPVGKKVTAALVGIIISVPVTAIVVALLASADAAFSELFSYLFSDFFGKFVSNLMIFAFGVPVAMYLFSLFYSNINKNFSNVMTYEQDRAFMSRIRIVPGIAAHVSVIPVIFVYIMFFVSQFAYFTSAFSNIVPFGMTYAEYARRGFFELCAVAVINAMIIASLNMFSKREGDASSTAIKIFTALISVFTLMLIGTALSKMVMYINAYGLTVLRVYTTWFMLLLAVLFLLVLLKQAFKRVCVTKAAVYSFVVMLFLLSFCNIDAVIANYNIESYKSGRLETLDISMMHELSDSAVEYVYPLQYSDDPVVAQDAKNYIERKSERLRNRSDSVLNFNIETDNARKTLGI